MANPPFVLASSSPRRRELLASLGISFTICKPSIDETQYPSEPPLDYVQRLSIEKAAAVASQVQHPALILAADTVVIDNGGTLEETVSQVDAALAKNLA